MSRGNDDSPHKFEALGRVLLYSKQVDEYDEKAAKAHSDRDEWIVNARRAGASLVEITHASGLTKARLSQVALHIKPDSENPT